MNKKNSLLPLLILLFISFGFRSDDWLIEKQKKYILYFTQEDKENKKEYTTIVNKGLKLVLSADINSVWIDLMSFLKEATIRVLILPCGITN